MLPQNRRRAKWRDLKKIWGVGSHADMQKKTYKYTDTHNHCSVYLYTNEYTTVIVVLVKRRLFPQHERSNNDQQWFTSRMLEFRGPIHTPIYANLMDEVACRIAMALKPKVDGMPTPTWVGFLMTNMDHSSTEISGPCTPLVNICYSKQYMMIKIAKSHPHHPIPALLRRLSALSCLPPGIIVLLSDLTHAARSSNNMPR